MTDSWLGNEINVWWEAAMAQGAPKRQADCVTGTLVTDYRVNDEAGFHRACEDFQVRLRACLGFQVRQPPQCIEELQEWTWRIRWIEALP